MKSPEEPNLSFQSQDFRDQHNKWTNFIGCGPWQLPGVSAGYRAVGLEYALVHDSHGRRDGSQGIAGHVQLGQGRNTADR